jgi:predicted dehydrogenase
MINFGIIGGGGISETHARAASEIEGVNVVAFCGANKEKVEALSSKYGGIPYADLPQFLTHEPLDAVIIGSPSTDRKELNAHAVDCTCSSKSQ